MALLDFFGGEVERLRFQKLLFLLMKKLHKPVYDFVPYRYGCFSFSANADLNTLAKYGQVIQTDTTWRKLDTQDYRLFVSEEDRIQLEALKASFEALSRDALIRYTYQQYPWYAINSKMKEALLSAEELEIIAEQRARDFSPVLFTIGYEGVSLEVYLNKLIAKNVRLLCDVRCNALSMKYGFSKKQLETACEGVGIRYTHLPALGIPSAKRQELNTPQDYNTLFTDYGLRIKGQQDELSKIVDFIQAYSRIALTCFEAEACRCHRRVLAEVLQLLPDWRYRIEHL